MTCSQNLLSVGAASLLFLAIASGQQTLWGQCGGSGYTGASSCVAGAVCTSYNPYYYQCIPGTAAPTTATTKTAPVTTSTLTTVTKTSAKTSSGATSSTKAASSSTTAAPPTTTTPTTTTTPSGSLATLQSGWYWVRAVESPNYHSYLQSKPTGTPGPAYLDSNLAAGQFQVSSGQLVYNTGGGAAPLYMHVEDPTDKTQRALRTWFNTTQNPYGTFAWSGDALTWSVADINRPNVGAWFVCGEQELYINTGAYLYQTPDGCVDETIHYYGNSVANL